MPLNNLRHQDSGIRDNYIRGSVADFLNQIIQQDSALSIVSAYFTIYAYDKLKDKLNDIDHLRFLFGESRFIRSLDPDKTDKKAYKIEDEGLKLTNRLEQRRVAKECSDWIDNKVEIHAFGFCQSLLSASLIFVRPPETIWDY